MADDNTERFARVGLKMNDKKTKGMRIDGAKKPPIMMSQEAIDRKRGVGQCRTHREKAKAIVQCQLCGVMSQRKVLTRHHSAGVCKRGRDEWATNSENPSNNQLTPSQATESIQEEEPCLPQEYCADILTGGTKESQCPAQCCSAKYTSKRATRINRHMEDTIFFEREARFPRCARCGIFSKTVGTSHQATKMCKDATETAEEANSGEVT